MAQSTDRVTPNEEMIFSTPKSPSVKQQPSSPRMKIAANPVSSRRTADRVEARISGGIDPRSLLKPARFRDTIPCGLRDGQGLTRGMRPASRPALRGDRPRVREPASTTTRTADDGRSVSPLPGRGAGGEGAAPTFRPRNRLLSNPDRRAESHHPRPLSPRERGDRSIDRERTDRAIRARPLAPFGKITRSTDWVRSGKPPDRRIGSVRENHPTDELASFGTWRDRGGWLRFFCEDRRADPTRSHDASPDSDPRSTRIWVRFRPTRRGSDRCPA